jgi:hypothetical protein
MYWTRRRAAFAFFALAGAAPLLGAHSVLAASGGRPGKPNEDDDDTTAVPNLFISPCGEPFRAPSGAPYPVVDWFRGADKNADGKLDRAEFAADAERFFKRLDINGDGFLSRYEILVYERRIVPEITGGSVKSGMNGAPRLWLAQYNSGPPPVDPGGDHPDPTAPPHPEHLDESGQGAAPYSLFEEPEPVLTADFNVNGVVTRANFLKVADMHFTTLDGDEKGFLTLKDLPETTVQKLLGKGKRRHF